MMMITKRPIITRPGLLSLLSPFDSGYWLLWANVDGLCNPVAADLSLVTVPASPTIASQSNIQQACQYGTQMSSPDAVFAAAVARYFTIA